ncbi:pyridoxal phosphate-dependent decarboxylase family protein [Actinomadura nitritigenes]|uniref:pyridoxal phosphate-dependent decarboxylase family protein n=1 Tax=Actinomadura nitritigenes TaxID=134602 RepID=UPI003685CE94
MDGFTPSSDPFILDSHARGELWRILAETAEGFAGEVGDLSAGVRFEPAEVRRALERFDFDKPADPVQVLQHAIDALRRLQPQVGHPRHFGMFDPAPTTMGVLADALVSLFNPCLATWEGSPFGVETERHLIQAFAGRFGYPGEGADGIVTSGGSEANLTALLIALAHRFPGYPQAGLRGLPGQPVVYCSASAHPSVARAARIAGLGDAAVHEVPMRTTGTMSGEALGKISRVDREHGLIPLLVTATAGTTGEGVIDPIAEIGEVARGEGLWLHVDAAWGGAAVLLPELKPAFADIERADSITFDPHKWMSVPMNCGMLLTRHPLLLRETFDVTAPFLRSQEGGTPDPFTRGIRWSRGFAGLKLLLSLAVAGWDGYEHGLRRQVSLGDRLRDKLRAEGWSVVNETPLPVVCFADERWEGEPERRFLTGVAATVNASGAARVFVARTRGRHALRACVTNHMTEAADVDMLVELLASARRAGLSAGHLDTDVAEPSTDCDVDACSTGVNFGTNRSVAG